MLTHYDCQIEATTSDFELTVIQSQLYQPAIKGVNRWSFAAISASHSNTPSTPRGNQSPGKDQRKSRKRMLGIQPGKKNDVAG
jgi:hypothetical protein